jgi:hypothetical protein
LYDPDRLREIQQRDGVWWVEVCELGRLRGRAQTGIGAIRFVACSVLGGADLIATMLSLRDQLTLAKQSGSHSHRFPTITRGMGCGPRSAESFDLIIILIGRKSLFAWTPIRFILTRRLSAIVVSWLRAATLTMVS